jgi:hypothetical protein
MRSLWNARVHRLQAVEACCFSPSLRAKWPHTMSAAARSAFLGLGLDHDRNCLIHAMLEGCACEVRFMVDGIAQSLTGGIVELRYDGWWNAPPTVRGNSRQYPAPAARSLALGAAILGAVGSGYFATINEATEASHTMKGPENTAEIAALRHRPLPRTRRAAGRPARRSRQATLHLAKPKRFRRALMAMTKPCRAMLARFRLNAAKSSHGSNVL